VGWKLGPGGESLYEGHGFSRAIKHHSNEGFRPLRYAFPSLYLQGITVNDPTSAAKAAYATRFMARLKPCPSYED
jgi:hypothetical protein